MTSSAAARRPDLRNELLTRRERDQAIRARIHPVDNPAPAAIRDEMRRIDDDNAMYLRNLIAEHGWPGRALVGDDGAHAAWLLAQHAPSELQEEWLPLLERAAQTGDASLTDWAYLLDRVLMHRGEPQVFGTQYVLREGNLEPHEIRDVDTLDDRRTKVGMEPFSEYAKLFAPK
jgi:hypothetical protein